MATCACEPSSDDVLPCGCIVTFLEREDMRQFMEGLGAENRHLSDEFYYRLGQAVGSEAPYAVGASNPIVGTIIYMNSSAVGAGTTLWLRKAGLRFTKRFGRLSTSMSLGLFNIGRVSSHSFGGVSNCVKGMNLFGAASDFRESLDNPRSLSRNGFLSNRTHLCDVTHYVVARELPNVGDALICGCECTKQLREGVRDEIYEREKVVVWGRRHSRTFTKILSDSRLSEMDLFANTNVFTGSLVYLSPRMALGEVLVDVIKGVVCLDGIAGSSPLLPPITRQQAQTISTRTVEEEMISQTACTRYVQVHAGRFDRALGGGNFRTA